MIRAATVDDALGIAAVHVLSWQAIYRGHFPDDYLDGLSVARRAESWLRWLADPAQATAVYQAPGGIVGFVSIGPSRDSDAPAQTGELTSIYLAPAVWRRGIGSKLMSWATAAAVARNWAKMTLWVLEGNAAARGFYEHCGWVADGATRREQLGAGVIHEIRYAWQAPAPHAA